MSSSGRKRVQPYRFARDVTLSHQIQVQNDLVRFRGTAPRTIGAKRRRGANDNAQSASTKKKARPTNDPDIAVGKNILVDFGTGEVIQGVLRRLDNRKPQLKKHEGRWCKCWHCGSTTVPTYSLTCVPLSIAYFRSHPCCRDRQIR